MNVSSAVDDRAIEDTSVGPTFICIGGARSASSWLGRACRAHPAIGWIEGEPKTFATVYWSEGIAGIRRTYADLTDYAVRGEKDPYYSAFGTSEIETVRALYPGVKILYLARNPPERAISHAALVRKRYLEKRSTKSFGSLFSVLRQTESPLMCRLNDVERTLKLWKAVFPAEQVLVINHDDIKRDQDAVLRAIADFIGVDVDGFRSDEANRRNFNNSNSAAFPDYPFLKYYLARRWSGAIDRLALVQGLDVSGWLERNRAVEESAVLGYRLLYPFARFLFGTLDGGVRRAGSDIKAQMRRLRLGKPRGK